MNEIIVYCWLKNNKEWYYPEKKVDLTVWDNIELLSVMYDGDLFYCYNNGEKEYGRLYRGKWPVKK
jgi:hypothetical protein